MNENTKPEEWIRQTAELTIKQLDQELPNPFSSDEGDWEVLQAWLLKVIKHKLDYDMQGLLQALYRIDLKESKVKEILTLAPPDDIPHLLTEEILKRQWQKILIRQKYS
ncbi:hypothetical protein [Peijinzhouia sedimentorum]